MYKTLLVLVVVLLLCLLASAAMASSATFAPLTSAAVEKAEKMILQAPNTGPPRSTIAVAPFACAAAECATPMDITCAHKMGTNLTGRNVATTCSPPATMAGHTTRTLTAAEAYAIPPPRPAAARVMRAEGRWLTPS